MGPAPYFLNVDLEIESTVSLRSLAREFGERVSIMYSGRMNGRHCLFVEIEIASTLKLKSPEKTIHALCALIESLSPNGRRLWKAAKRKEFDIGFDARFYSHRANRFTIDAKTLRRVTELGASIAVTFYREDNTNTSNEKTKGEMREPCAINRQTITGFERS